jgi:hypothetical protein
MPKITVQEYMKQAPRYTGGLGVRRPHALLGDGTILSIQASRDHYSKPKTNEGPWASYEVGFPARLAPGSTSVAEEIVLEPLLPYAEPLNGGLSGVYAYVPSEDLERYVASHGGIVGDTRMMKINVIKQHYP